MEYETEKIKYQTATVYKNMYFKQGTSISFNEMIRFAGSPLKTKKKETPFVHPSNASGKTKLIIEQNNRMSWLWVDVDSGDKTLAELLKTCTDYKITNAVIYSTASAMRLKNNVMQGHRWRVVILPNQSLCVSHWVTLQQALAKIFGGGNEATKITQCFYLPSCNDGGYYEYAIV